MRHFSFIFSVVSTREPQQRCIWWGGQGCGWDGGLGGERYSSLTELMRGEKGGILWDSKQQGLLSVSGWVYRKRRNLEELYISLCWLVGERSPKKVRDYFLYRREIKHSKRMWRMGRKKREEFHRLILASSLLGCFNLTDVRFENH